MLFLMRNVYTFVVLFTITAESGCALSVYIIVFVFGNVHSAKCSPEMKSAILDETL